MNTKKVEYPTRRRILPPDEKQGLEDVVQHEAAVKTETDEMFPGSQVSKGKSDQVRRIEKTLEEGKMEEPDGKVARNRLEKRAKELADYIIPNLVPRKYLGLRPSKNGVQDLDFQKATQHAAYKEMSPEVCNAAQEYKNIMRMLGREEMANIEHLRPE